MAELNAPCAQFLESLRRAASNNWSGRIEVVLPSAAKSQPIGVIVLYQGRIAWAVSQDQPENLGDFLAKLGRVTNAQLAPVRKRFVEEGGKRKLGELMEEAGLIRKPVLRRCLLLHTRRAFDTFLAHGRVSADLKLGEIHADKEMSFALEEIMPGKNPARDSGAQHGDRKAKLLECLAEIPGYQISAVLTAEGEVLHCHSIREDFDPALLAAYLASILEASTNAAVTADLGAIQFLMLDCVHGSLVARWIDPARKHLVAVLVGEESQLGSVKFELNSAVPAIAQYLLKP